jgi:ubiquinone/menaquinone biosynthesis C-methylase UbiE
MTQQPVDQDQLNKLFGRVMGDIGGALGLLTAYVGDQLGLYGALAGGGSMTSEQLATATDLDERSVREWLAANATAHYVNYDAESGTFSMTPEQAVVFSGEGHPQCAQGFFQNIMSLFIDEPKVTEAFRTGNGVPWSDRHPCLFCGTERFFRPHYAMSLVKKWIPALEGVKDRLEAGAKVADIGCGHGSSTILLAKSFPNSTFYGFDYHAASIEHARERAKEAGVEGNTVFETVTAKDFPGSDYDMVAIFDALHDMGDPVGAAAHIRSTLKEGGTFMVVEPFAGDSLEDNMNLLGRISYAASAMVCTQASLAQEVGLALGAQAGQKRLTEVLNEAGFSHVRRAAETEANIVLEVRV